MRDFKEEDCRFSYRDLMNKASTALYVLNLTYGNIYSRELENKIDQIQNLIDKEIKGIDP